MLRYLKLHKILHCKVSPNIQTPLKNICTNIFATLKTYFSKYYSKCCVKIPTIITRKVFETFLKYFVYILDRAHKNSTKYSGQFGATFIEIFHASFLLRYLKYYTKSCNNFSAKILEKFQIWVTSFSPNISTTLQKYFPKGYKKCCVNIPTIITRKVSESFRNILCMVWTEHTNISRNVLASSEHHLLKYFTQASC